MDECLQGCEILEVCSPRHLKLMRKKRNLSPRDILVTQLKDLVGKDVWCEELENQVPRKWEKHGDLLLLPQNSFQNDEWKMLGEQLWIVVSKCLNAERIAMKRAIMADDYRTPQVTLLKGSNTWVRHVDNKIIYEYDIVKSMFSIGNISEKLRISKMNCKGETIVDLFAGIGYFTLPFLVHAKADMVHACEWNPQAISALKHNLVLNKMQMQCHVHQGDCREVCPSDVADRVNLGLIPSSALAWEVACKALKNMTGGILYIHGNVDLVKSSDSACKRDLWWKWADDVKRKIAQLATSIGRNWIVSVENVHRIKSYAANVDHVVVDIRCKPYE